ncbi:MAG: MerR family transcriptional regulator [Micromonosporaceae bacterium]|nr:MerR family transcriptional regulator [Micromonosporaceae bacterium]
MTGGLRSGQVAAAAGVNPQTLRYYERRGLVDEPDRTVGGHRVYPPETVTVLRVIKAAQRLGFTLSEVAELLTAGAHQHDPQHGAHRHGSRRESGLQSRTQAKLAEVEQKIADLSVIRDTLRRAVAAGCDDPIICANDPRCPLPFAELAQSDQPAAAGTSSGRSPT